MFARGWPTAPHWQSRQTESMRQLLLTGASSDIGLAVCRLYLAKGFRIVAHYNKGRPDFDALVRSSANITPLQIDLADPANLERAITDQPNLFVATDVLINAAAVYEPLPFEEISAQAVLNALSINLLPGIILTRAITPKMSERGWGRIVNISSIGVKFGGGGTSFAYALSKHAMEFMPADHKTWAADNVLINSLRIGVTDTRLHNHDPGKDMTRRIALIPVGRMATPEEMAKSIYWFGSEENTFITGQTIAIAGGE